jgi:ribonucleoside-diphosphate reductase alpha chain
MKITKRDGKLENLSLDKIVYRLKKLTTDKSLGKLSTIDTDLIAQKVISTIYDGVSSTELDEEAARISISMTENLEFGKLASRIIISNIHKNTTECFSEVMEKLYNNIDSNGSPAPILADDIISIIRENKDQLNEAIDYSRDYLFDYFGFKTLEKSYLMKINGKVIERPQHLYMRVALFCNQNSIENTIKTYNLLSQHYFTMASPVMFNSCSRLANCVSCFLLGTDDSITGIFKTIGDCAQISKVGGGIGVHINNIRSKGAVIKGTNGVTDGIIPMLKVYNECAKYVNQAGKRKGSFAIYLSPEHPDIFEFLDLRKNQGSEDMRARDLFLAMWISDLFMKQVESDSDWYLMDPQECPGLVDVYGEKYEELYWSYVSQGKFRRKVKAQEIWMKILESQIETGTPYILYKDRANKMSNQKNIGVIKSSNLCVAPETMILTSNGYYKIKDLENQEVNIWNGKEFTKTKVQKTGENQELIKVKLSNGSELECTPYHKFYIAKGKRPNQYPMIRKIEAKDLTKDMKLIKSEFPIIKEGLSDFPYPYEHGIFSADGTLEQKKETIFQCNYKSLEGKCYCGYHIKMYEEKDTDHPTIYCQGIVGKGNPRITLYSEKKKLVQYINSRLEILPEDNNKRINIRLPMELKSKYTVPINYNINIKLRWLEGLSDGDGSICKSANTMAIQISSVHKEFLENVKYLLQTLGCDPKVLIMNEEGIRLLPKNDGSNELGEYNCQTCYRLLITSWDVAKLYELGFRPKRLKISGVYPKNNTKRWIQVDEIIKTERISDTYCFKEEKRGMGIFNGILTGQCSEILLYSDDKQYACCNLSSIALSKFVEYDKNHKPFYNHQHLFDIAKHIVLPMNNIIDCTFYPVPETKLSNELHRPIGVGVQDLSGTFIKMRLPFDSDEAKKLNKEIFETIYYGLLTGSMELAKKDGPYSSFKGSPMSEGKFQFDLHSEFNGIDIKDYISDRWDWETLRKNIMEFGVRNSTVTTCMPTASSAQIMGNTESFEQFDSCIFKRRVLAGEFTVANKHLVEDLTELKLWNKEMKDLIIAHNGSIQEIETIPENIRNLYKTIWEIKMKDFIDQSADRSVFIDQTQSLNLFMSSPTIKKLTNMHFYGFNRGLKTGIYYLRSRSQTTAAKFTIDPKLEKKIKDKKLKGKSLTKKEVEAAEILACSIENKEDCMMCSS